MLNQIELIEWPEWWAQKTFWSRFLIGMPIWGAHIRILNAAKIILNKRTSDTERLWSNCPLMVAEREKVFKIIDRYIKWPNHYFVPDDKAAIVFGFIPGIWIDFTDIVDDIAKEFVIENAAVVGCLADSIEKGTLFDFFNYLASVTPLSEPIPSGDKK